MRVLSVSEADKRNGGSEVTEKGEERRGCVDGILAEGGGSEEDAVFDDGEGEREIGGVGVMGEEGEEGGGECVGGVLESSEW